jgi:hypothetical protein
MPRLVVNQGSPGAWEIELKPGANSLGRGFSNDFKINDPSVSGSHCEIVVGDHGAVIKDLGSTNGTYVNRAKIEQAPLQSGQTVHLGGVEMRYYTDTDGAAVETASPAPPAAVRISVPQATARPAAPAGGTVRIAAPPPPAPPVSTPTTQTGTQNCKFHPRTAGRFFCKTCNLYYCELCVATRPTGGTQKKFCRQCGTECTPVQVSIQPAAKPKGFFALLPGAFLYPFRGAGVLVLVFATLVFAGLDIIMRSWWSFLLVAAALGYVFSFMQNIIHTTAAGDDEMASIPGMDDVFGGFFRLAVTVTICFGVPIGLLIAKFFSEESNIPAMAIWGTAALGCFYFPMAFLAVAMKDNALAANPLIVIPSIFKVPLEYLIAAFLVLTMLGIRFAGTMAIAWATGETRATKDMSMLFIAFGVRACFTLINVYLLTVSMRILGLLYRTKKQELGWFSH